MFWVGQIHPLWCGQYEAIGLCFNWWLMVVSFLVMVHSFLTGNWEKMNSIFNVFWTILNSNKISRLVFYVTIDTLESRDLSEVWKLRITESSHKLPSEVRLFAHPPSPSPPLHVLLLKHAPALSVQPPTVSGRGASSASFYRHTDSGEGRNNLRVPPRARLAAPVRTVHTEPNTRHGAVLPRPVLRTLTKLPEQRRSRLSATTLQLFQMLEG